MVSHQSDSRSDERIHDAVLDRLDDDYDVDATLIEVSVADGEVTLLGYVPVQRMKDRAEDLAQAVDGVKDVHDELHVAESGSGCTEIPVAPSDPAKR